MEHQNQIIFESITEIPEYLRGASFISHSGQNVGKSLSWDLNLGYEGALKMAEDGGYWEEGASKMIEATSAINELKSEGQAPYLEYDVTGPVLDMDEYLSGSPECFEQIMDDEPVSIVKIGVQLYTPGGNDAREYIFRGAALMSVIDDLEAQGIRVELWGCLSGYFRRDEKKPVNKREGIDMRISLKRAEESWSPSGVAFGIAHPAMGRRLGFAVASSFKSNGSFCNSGHGLNFEKDRPAGSDFDVWFGYSDMVNNRYSSVEQALSKITKEVDRQLKSGKEYAAIK